MYPKNVTNPEFNHDWVTYEGTTEFGRATWQVCAKCGRVRRSDDKQERCAPEEKNEAPR